MSERQIVDILTRTRTSRSRTGRSGYSLMTKGVLGASHTAALAVRIRSLSVGCRGGEPRAPSAALEAVEGEVEKVVTLEPSRRGTRGVGRVERAVENEGHGALGY